MKKFWYWSLFVLFCIVNIMVTFSLVVIYYHLNKDVYVNGLVHLKWSAVPPLVALLAMTVYSAREIPILGFRLWRRCRGKNL